MNITFYDENPQKGTSFQLPYTVITDSFLDEELDVCPIELKNTTVDTPFPRFSVAAFCTTEGATPSYWFVGSDEVHTNVATGLSDHTVQLIEPTKWLERFMVGNKAVTQPIYTDYLDNPATITLPAQIKNTSVGVTQEDLKPKEDESGKSYVVYKTPINPTKDRLPIYDVAAFDVIYGNGVNWTCTFSIDGKVLYKETHSYLTSEVPTKTVFGTLGLDQYGYKKGVASIVYEMTSTLDNTLTTKIYSYAAKYEVAIMVPEEEPVKITLKDAAMSMICAAEILKSNGGNPIPRFRLNDEITKELALITSPEITVTNATLREALDEIGKVINSITRLDIIPEGDRFVYEITFERYCKDTAADLSELGPAFEIAKKVSCEDYCTALDTTVDNLVNYKDGGSVWDPCCDLWRTVRSEDASYRVTEDTAEIFTAFPIERIDGLFCRIYVGDSQEQFKERDLTPYLFEASEYAALSSYTPAYPYSKAYALCYTLGKRNITGLNFTVPDPVHTIFEHPALVNIVNKAFGELNEGEDPLPGWPFLSLNALDFTKMLFKVKYVPTGAARVIMRKPNAFGKPESILAYNQSAAKLDASAFGRSMFGAVLRMGNEETTYTYITTLGAKVPEKGERFGEDGYIAEIREEYAPHQKKVTLTVVEGFNRLSQFVGVNKTQRLFEISERMSLDRHIVYEDKCLISTERRENLSGAIVTYSNATPPGETTPDPYMNGSFLEHLRSAFDESGSSGSVAPFARVKGYDDAGEALAECFLPCIPYAMGNALSFTVGFEDNYGAGRRVDGSISEGFYATETDVRYTDLFGRVAEMELLIDDGFWSGHTKLYEANYREAANAMPALPAIVKSLPSPIVHTYLEKDRLYIDKDTREAIKTLTYQVSFLGDNGIKVSPYFTECLPYVRDANVYFVIVPITTPITNTTEWISVSGSIPKAYCAEVNEEPAVKVSFSVPAGSTGWAAVSWFDTKSGSDSDTRKRFLFGSNKPVGEEGKVTVYFNFYH